MRSALSLALGVSLLATPIEASAITRAQVIDRAHQWHVRKVPYSQARSRDGYRTDCSGYVSMAWALPNSLTTWTIPRVAHRIGKGELKPGDVLLNNSGGALRHVVIFAGWANAAQSAYIGYEENGPVGRAVRRIIPYPFFFAKGAFKPWRFNGIADGPGVKPVAAPKNYVDVIRGADRYVTAVASSRSAFKASRTVVVASGENWSDAVSASSLAGAYDAPLLLVRQRFVHAEVLNEIRRLGARDIVIVGSERSVGPRAVAALRRAGAVWRIAGVDRYGTAAKVAAETVKVLERNPAKDYDGTVMVVSGEQPTDALAATPLAAGKAWPILFTRPGSLSPEARAAIRSVGMTRGVVVGSRTTISSVIGTQLHGALRGPVETLKGVDRYSSSVAVAEFAAENGLEVRDPIVVTNTASTDAVAAGVAQGARGSVLLVTRKDMLSTPVARTLLANRNDIGRVKVLGASMTAPVRERINGELRRK